MADEFSLKMPNFHVTFRDLLHAVKLRHGTNGFTSLPKEGVLRIFLPSRPPKPLLLKHETALFSVTQYISASCNIIYTDACNVSGPNFDPVPPMDKKRVKTQPSMIIAFNETRLHFTLLMFQLMICI